MGTSHNGLYISSDAGQNWEYLALGGILINDIKIDYSDPNTLYVGTNSGLFKSINAGADWQLILLEFVETLAIDHLNPETIFAGTSTEVFASPDAGSNWANISNSLDRMDIFVRSIAINHQLPNNIYIGTSVGVYKSEDETYDWELKNVGFASISGRTELEIALIDSIQVIYTGSDEGVFSKSEIESDWEYIGMVNVSTLEVPDNNPSISPRFDKARCVCPWK